MSQSKSQHDGMPDGLPESLFDQLRHDLMNPLATIRGRAQLLARAVDRSLGMDEDERVRLLRGLAVIDQAVMVAVEVLDDAESRHDKQQEAPDRENGQEAYGNAG